MKNFENAILTLALAYAEAGNPKAALAYAGLLSDEVGKSRARQAAAVAFLKWPDGYSRALELANQITINGIRDQVHNAVIAFFAAHGMLKLADETALIQNRELTKEEIGLFADGVVAGRTDWWNAQAISDEQRAQHFAIAYAECFIARKEAVHAVLASSLVNDGPVKDRLRMQVLDLYLSGCNLDGIRSMLRSLGRELTLAEKDLAINAGLNSGRLALAVGAAALAGRELVDEERLAVFRTALANNNREDAFDAVIPLTNLEARDAALKQLVDWCVSSQAAVNYAAAYEFAKLIKNNATRMAALESVLPLFLHQAKVFESQEIVTLLGRQLLRTELDDLLNGALNYGLVVEAKEIAQRLGRKLTGAECFDLLVACLDPNAPEKVVACLKLFEENDLPMPDLKSIVIV